MDACGGIAEDAAAGHLNAMANDALMRDVGDNLAQAICWFPHNLVTGPKEDTSHLGVLQQAFGTLSREKLTAPAAFDVQHWVLATYPHGYNPKDGKYDPERGGKPLWQKRVLAGGDFPYVQGTVFRGKGGDMFEKRQGSRK